MPGPPPKPTAIRELEGNPCRRPLNTHEPKPTVTLPKPPAHLSPAAKRLWNRVGPMFVRLGVMTEADEMAFALLVESYTAWATLVEQAREAGPIVKINGQPVPNPLLSRADKEAEKFRRMLVEFGATPASRSRINAEGTTPADDLDTFLKLAQ